MVQVYTVNYKSQLFIAKEMFLSVSVSIMVIYIYTLVRPDAASFLISYIPWMIIGYFLIEVMPTILFHRQYYSYNKDTGLTVDPVQRTMAIEENKVPKTFRFDEIKRVELVLNGDLYNGAQHALNVWGIYHYAILELGDGSRYVITCLLVNNLRKFFPSLGIDVVKRKKAIPSISLAQA